MLHRTGLLQRVEKGRTNLGVVMLVHLADALGVAPVILMRRANHEAGKLQWSDLDLDRGAVVLDENKTDDDRACARSGSGAVSARTRKASWSGSGRRLARTRRVESFGLGFRSFIQRAAQRAMAGLNILDLICDSEYLKNSQARASLPELPGRRLVINGEA
ncbi:hypothetical protein WMF31_32345 [Sorangium sp. So ce1036]|uniref:hypothetical protein n=1 Tax=Sorangium sp. So ce1036 TaxID=3133328 RepID=UPI003F03320B